MSAVSATDGPGAGNGVAPNSDVRGNAIYGKAPGSHDSNNGSTPSTGGPTTTPSTPNDPPGIPSLGDAGGPDNVQDLLDVASQAIGDGPVPSTGSNNPAPGDLGNGLTPGDIDKLLGVGESTRPRPDPNTGDSWGDLVQKMGDLFNDSSNSAPQTTTPTDPDMSGVSDFTPKINYTGPSADDNVHTGFTVTPAESTGDSVDVVTGATDNSNSRNGTWVDEVGAVHFGDGSVLDPTGVPITINNDGSVTVHLSSGDWNIQPGGVHVGPDGTIHYSDGSTFNPDEIYSTAPIAGDLGTDDSGIYSTDPIAGDLGTDTSSTDASDIYDVTPTDDGSTSDDDHHSDDTSDEPAPADPPAPDDGGPTGGSTSNPDGGDDETPSFGHHSHGARGSSPAHQGITGGGDSDGAGGGYGWTHFGAPKSDDGDNGEEKPSVGHHSTPSHSSHGPHLPGSGLQGSVDDQQYVGGGYGWNTLGAPRADTAVPGSASSVGSALIGGAGSHNLPTGAGLTVDSAPLPSSSAPTDAPSDDTPPPENYASSPDGGVLSDGSVPSPDGSDTTADGMDPDGGVLSDGSVPSPDGSDTTADGSGPDPDTVGGSPIVDGSDPDPAGPGPIGERRVGARLLLLLLLPVGAVIVAGGLAIPWLHHRGGPVAPANMTGTPTPTTGQPVTTAASRSNPPPPPAPATDTPITSATAPQVTAVPSPRRVVTTTAAAPPPAAPTRSPAPQVTTTTHPVVTTPPTTFFAPSQVNSPIPSTTRDHAPTAQPPAGTAGRTRD